MRRIDWMDYVTWRKIVNQNVPTPFGACHPAPQKPDTTDHDTKYVTDTVIAVILGELPRSALDEMTLNYIQRRIESLPKEGT